MLDTFRYFFSNLPRAQRRNFKVLAAFIICAAFVELMALAGLALFITSLTSLDAVLGSSYALAAKRYLGDALFLDRTRVYWALGLFTVGSILAKNLLAAWQTYFAARLDGAMNVHYGNKMLRGFMNTPYETVMRANSADVLQVIGWRQFIGLFFGSLNSVLCDISVSLLLFVSLFIIQPVVTTLVALTLCAIGYAAFSVFRGKITSISHRSAKVQMTIGQVQMKCVQGVRDITLFNRAADSLAVYDREQTQHARYQAAQRVCERATVWVLETVAIAGVVLGSLLLLSSPEVSTGRMMGTLSLLAVSAWRILPALYRSIGALGLMRGYIPVLNRVRSFLEQIDQAEGANKSHAQEPLPPLAGSIEMRGLSFTYATASSPALSEVSLSIRKGQFIGIIGHSGAGKSTLADILSGLLEPTGGAILVDGRPLHKEVLAAWRAQLGFVSQRPYLFDGTVAENIAFAVDERHVDLAKVEQCCKLAGIMDFLSALPDRLHSVIGERGNQLSGGQAQRIAIARALYNDPQVLIFDEATSALDDMTEKKIRETIVALSGHRTIIIIAHRLKTVEDCDGLIWLRQGRVVEVGPPGRILPRYMADEGSEDQYPHV